MVILSVSDAIALVRKNLDEVEPNGSVMYGPEMDEMKDNNSIDDIIAKNLPEAINSVHLAAPVQLLEGETHTFTSQDAVSIIRNYDLGILSFTLGSDSNYLRLVAFQAVDSPIVVTDVLAESSPEGHKQLNRNICGRADRPRLVLMQGRHSGPAFKYYSLTNETAQDQANTPIATISQFSYIKEQIFTDNATGYNISRKLRQNIIDCLTAMVMETYNDQRSQSYYQKANNFPTI